LDYINDIDYLNRRYEIIFEIVTQSLEITQVEPNVKAMKIFWTMRQLKFKFDSPTYNNENQTVYLSKSPCDGPQRKGHILDAH